MTKLCSSKQFLKDFLWFVASFVASVNDLRIQVLTFSTETQTKIVGFVKMKII